MDKPRFGDTYSRGIDGLDGWNREAEDFLRLTKAGFLSSGDCSPGGWRTRYERRLMSRTGREGVDSKSRNGILHASNKLYRVVTSAVSDIGFLRLIVHP
jgi:hypothetical protein